MRVECGEGFDRPHRFIGKAQLDGLGAGHPRFGGEQRFDFVGGLAGLVGVRRHQGILDLVEQVGVAAHFVSVTALDAPGLVHHDHGVFGDADNVCGHQDHATHGSRQANHVAFHTRRVVAQ
ncbi:hypothetical protein D3C77_632210 [compost metagenome]